MLPNFVYFGVPKSGSATLTELLKKHPQVYCPRQKELNFFNRDREYEKGLAYYQEQYFRGWQDESVICDNSIGYASGNFRKTAARVRAALTGDVRVLLTVRQPARRAYSQYCMARYKGGFEKLSFLEAVESAIAAENTYGDEDLRRVETGSNYSSARDMAIFRHALYLVPGRYADIAGVLQELFGVENVLILFTDDIAKDLSREFGRLTDFLGIDAVDVSGVERSNEATTLKYPWLKRGYNIAYSIPWVRSVVGALSPERRKFLRRRLMSWNYTRNTSVPPPSPEAMALLDAYYENQMADLGKLLGRDMSGTDLHNDPAEARRA